MLGVSLPDNAFELITKWGLGATAAFLLGAWVYTQTTEQIKAGAAWQLQHMQQTEARLERQDVKIDDQEKFIRTELKDINERSTDAMKDFATELRAMRTAQ